MTTLRLSRRHLLAAASCAFPLAGCSLLPDRSPARIYRLDPSVAPPGTGPMLHGALAIVMPTAAQSLDTDRIALTLGATRFDYYADAVWTDRVPALLQTLLVEAFESSGRIANVGRDAVEVTKGYLLETDIRDFQARYRGQGGHAPVVAVSLELQLIAVPGRRTVGRTLIAEDVQASENTLDSAVRAFDTATGKAMDRGLAWALSMMREGREAA